MNTHPKSSLPGKLLLLVCSVAFASGIAEVYVRARRFGDVDTATLRRRLEATSFVRTIMQPSPDPELYYELKRDLRISRRGVPIFTDSRGIRVPVEPRASAASAVKIAVLGDSSAFGWNVRYEDSYGDQLRGMLEGRFNCNVQMTNYSVPGYNSRQEARVFEKRVREARPDLLILHYDHNDSEPAAVFMPPDFLWPSDGDNPLHSAFIKLLIRTYRITLNEHEQDKVQGKVERVGEYVVSGPAYEEHLEALKRLAAMARESRIPVVVVIFNAYVERDPQYEVSPLFLKLHVAKARFFQRIGFHVLDLYPVYQKKLAEMGWPNLREWWVSNRDVLDAHPNREGHRFIAECLLEKIDGDPELARVFRR